MRITIRLEFEISFPNNVVERENEANVAESGETPEAPEPAEVEVDMFPILNIVQGIPGGQAPLMGSLHGILGVHAP